MDLFSSNSYGGDMSATLSRRFFISMRRCNRMEDREKGYTNKSLLIKKNKLLTYLGQKIEPLRRHHPEWLDLIHPECSGFEMRLGKDGGYTPHLIKK